MNCEQQNNFAEVNVTLSDTVHNSFIGIFPRLKHWLSDYIRQTWYILVSHIVSFNILCKFMCILLYNLIIGIRDAPVDRPKIGTGRFLLIMRDRQPAGFCLFFGRFFRKCEHVICVEGIRQEHNKHRKTDTMKRTAVGVTLLAHK